jgi:hypothetical protein
MLKYVCRILNTLLFASFNFLLFFLILRLLNVCTLSLALPEILHILIVNIRGFSSATLSSHV